MNNNVIGVVILAVAFGIAARRLATEHTSAILIAARWRYELMIKILHWIIALVPLAVFCKVGFVVGTQGFAPSRRWGGLSLRCCSGWRCRGCSTCCG